MPIDIGLMSITKHIRVDGERSGTAFYLSHAKRDYLVTARHLFAGPNEAAIELQDDDRWRSLRAAPLFPSEPEVDIACVEFTGTYLFNTHSPRLPRYSSEDVRISEDCYFMGYPFSLGTEVRYRDQRIVLFTFPLVKKGLVSGALRTKAGEHLGFYIDGHNNPGFSGGPCLIYRESGWHVFGIVSSYVQQDQRLFDERGDVRMVLYENSGLFVCHDIVHVNRLLEGQGAPQAELGNGP